VSGENFGLAKNYAAAEDVYCPAFFCDHGKKHIDEIGLAMYYYDVDDKGNPEGEALVMHKQCGRLVEYRRGKKFMGDELKVLLDRLPLNATPIETWRSAGRPTRLQYANSTRTRSNKRRSACPFWRII